MPAPLNLNSVLQFRMNEAYYKNYTQDSSKVVDGIFKLSQEYNFTRLQNQQNYYLSKCETLYNAIEKKITMSGYSMFTFMNAFTSVNCDVNQFLSIPENSKYTSVMSKAYLNMFSENYTHLKNNMIEGYQSSIKFSQALRKTQGLNYNIFTLDNKDQTLSGAYTLTEQGLEKWMRTYSKDFSLTFGRSGKDNKFGVSLGFNSALTSDQVNNKMQQLKAQERNRLLNKAKKESIAEDVFESYYNKHANIKEGIYREFSNGRTKFIDLTQLQNDYKFLVDARDKGRIVNAKTGETNISGNRLTEMLSHNDLISSLQQIVNGRSATYSGLQKYLDNVSAIGGSDVEFQNGTEYSVKTFGQNTQSPKLLRHTSLNQIYDNFKNRTAIERTMKIINEKANATNKKDSLTPPAEDRTKLINNYVLKGKQLLGKSIQNAKQQAGKGGKFEAFLQDYEKRLMELDDVEFLNVCYENGMLINEKGWQSFCEDWFDVNA